MEFRRLLLRSMRSAVLLIALVILTGQPAQASESCCCGPGAVDSTSACRMTLEASCGCTLGRPASTLTGISAAGEWVTPPARIVVPTPRFRRCAAQTAGRPSSRSPRPEVRPPRVV